jgi:hypothetical protein
VEDNSMFVLRSVRPSLYMYMYMYLYMHMHMHMYMYYMYMYTFVLPPFLHHSFSSLPFSLLSDKLQSHLRASERGHNSLMRDWLASESGPAE